MGSKPRGRGVESPDPVTEIAAEIETGIDDAAHAGSAIEPNVGATREHGTIAERGDQHAAPMSEITDGLIDHVQRLRRQTRGLLATLDEAAERIADLSEGTAPSQDAGGGVKRSSQSASAPRSPDDPADELMIRATQLAVAGSEREDIAEVLLAEFEVENPAPIIDQIIGPQESSDPG